MASWRLGGIRHQVNHQRHLSPVERVLSWPFLITPRVVPCVPPACSSPSGCWWPRPPSSAPRTTLPGPRTPPRVPIFPVRSPATQFFLSLSPPIPAGSIRGTPARSQPPRVPPGGTVSFLEIHSGAGSVTGPVFVAARAPVTRFLAVARPSFPVVQTARTRRHNCFPFFFLHRTRMKHFH